MEFINQLIDSYNIPVLTAFLLGIITSISPCPLATNITAIAFISKDIKSSRETLLSGLFYIFGRAITYTLLATLIYFGLSSFQVSSIFQGWGDKLLGPLMLIIGLFMFGIVKVKFNAGGARLDKVKDWLSKRGYLGSLLLGMIFALAFCPYSGVLFFGALIPMVLKSTEGLLLAPLFALGTSLPVVIFAVIIAFSIDKIGKAFEQTKTVGAITQKVSGGVFIAIGLYYILKPFIN
jgi:cytochrome c biogenesis protein CcdA